MAFEDFSENLGRGGAVAETCAGWIDDLQADGDLAFVADGTTIQTGNAGLESGALVDQHAQGDDALAGIGFPLGQNGSERFVEPEPAFADSLHDGKRGEGFGDAQ